jgi:hypothetical protein
MHPYQSRWDLDRAMNGLDDCGHEVRNVHAEQPARWRVPIFRDVHCIVETLLDVAQLSTPRKTCCL